MAKSKEEVKAANPRAAKRTAEAQVGLKLPGIKGAPLDKGLRVPSADALAEIVALARQQILAEQVVADISASLADAQKILARIQTEDLPQALAAAGLSTLTLDSGEKVEVKNDYTVGILVENREKAFDWLEARGYDGIIKTEVTVSFGKGDISKAQALLIKLQKAKLPAELSRDIHYQTLKAWVREMETKDEKTKKAKKYPQELFGVTPIDKAKITAPKAGK